MSYRALPHLIALLTTAGFGLGVGALGQPDWEEFVLVKTLHSVHDTRAKNRLMRVITSGQVHQVRFDACPYDDEGWQPRGDPIGGIKCGEIYTVQFRPETREWVSEGLDEGASWSSGTRSVRTHTGAPRTLETPQVFIFNAPFDISLDLTVSYRDEIVGHLDILPDQL